jgi:hypothetical protein
MSQTSITPVIRPKQESSSGVTSREMRAPKSLETPEGFPPFFTQPLESLTVMDGERIIFSTVVEGTPAPEIKWFQNGKGVQQNPDFHVNYDAETGKVTLEITDVFPQDTGFYECIAVNQFGKATVSASLTVEC